MRRPVGMRASVTLSNEFIANSELAYPDADERKKFQDAARSYTGGAFGFLISYADSQMAGQEEKNAQYRRLMSRLTPPLDKKLDLGATHSPNNNTLLHEAAQYGIDNIANYLIDFGTPLEVFNTEMQSPLHMAARCLVPDREQATINIIEKLITSGCDPNISEIPTGIVPPIASSTRGAITQTLLRHGADPSYIKRDGQPATIFDYDEADETSLCALLDAGVSTYALGVMKDSKLEDKTIYIENAKIALTQIDKDASLEDRDQYEKTKKELAYDEMFYGLVKERADAAYALMNNFRLDRLKRKTDHRDAFDTLEDHALVYYCNLGHPEKLLDPHVWQHNPQKMQRMINQLPPYFATHHTREIAAIHAAADADKAPDTRVATGWAVRNVIQPSHIKEMS